jgi:hypothetical protein
VIGGQTLKCHVLENGTRLLTQETFLTAMGRAPKAKGGTGSRTTRQAPFLVAQNLQPYITDEVQEKAQAIEFRNEYGRKVLGFDARLLPMVCEVYLKLRDDGDNKPVLNQPKTIKACDLLMRALAHVGIIALVDEATGYQEQRARDELAKILEHYIVEELRPWTKTFPDEFFTQVYRIQGWAYKPGTAKRTPFVGHLINKYVYEQLPPGVLDELRRRNPRTEAGYRKFQHHRFLTADTGNPHLDAQIREVMMLMRIARDKADFEDMFERAFPPKQRQMRLPLIVDVPAETDAA